MMTPRSDVGRNISTVVRIAPTRVTNITGFLIIARGLSLMKASPMAGPAIFQSNNEGALWVILIPRLKKFALKGQVMFHYGAKRERGQVGQRADEQHGADQQHDKGEPGH